MANLPDCYASVCSMQMASCVYINAGIVNLFLSVIWRYECASLIPWVQTRLEGCQTPSLQYIVYFLKKCWDAKFQHCILSGCAKFPKEVPYFLRNFGICLQRNKFFTFWDPTVTIPALRFLNPSIKGHIFCTSTSSSL